MCVIAAMWTSHSQSDGMVLQVHVLIEYCLLSNMDALYTERYLWTRGISPCITRSGKNPAKIDTTTTVLALLEVS